MQRVAATYTFTHAMLIGHTAACVCSCSCQALPLAGNLIVGAVLLKSALVPIAIWPADMQDAPTYATHGHPMHCSCCHSNSTGSGAIIPHQSVPRHPSSQHQPSSNHQMMPYQQQQQHSALGHHAVVHPSHGGGSASSGQPITIHLHNAVNTSANADANAEQTSNQLTRVLSSLRARVRQAAGNPLITAAVAAGATLLLHNHTPMIKRASPILARRTLMSVCHASCALFFATRTCTTLSRKAFHVQALRCH